MANLYPGSKGEDEPGSSRLLGYAKYNGRGKERDEAATTRRSSFKKLSAHTPLKGPETFLCTIVGIPEIDRANNHGLRGLEKGLDRSESFSLSFPPFIFSFCSITTYIVAEWMR